MTAYKKTMREALQEVSSYKLEEEVELDENLVKQIAKKHKLKSSKEINAKIKKHLGFSPTQDPLYLDVFIAKDTAAMKNAMKTLASIRGPQALTNLQNVVKKVMSEETDLDEAKMSSKQIAALKKAYEPMRGGRLSMDNATKLGNLMDRFDKDKDLLIQLFKADIPFVSKIAMTRLISKHKMKGAELNKLADKDEFYRKMYGESLDEDGHADVASAIRQCKTVMEDAQQIMAKLQTMSPEDSLPTWWTNKFAVASNSMNKMRDYIVNPLGEALDKEDEPTVKKVVKMLKKASGAHAGQAKDLEKAIDEDSVEIRKEKN